MLLVRSAYFVCSSVKIEHHSIRIPKGNMEDELQMCTIIIQRPLIITDRRAE